MAWYAYCVGERTAFPELDRHRKPIPLDFVKGLGGNQVFLYPASDLAIIVSQHDPRQSIDPKSGVDHARVVSDCFHHSTVLPFRFGTVFHDDESLRRSIRSNHRHFQGNIDKLRGKAEMHLKVIVDDCALGLPKQGATCKSHLSDMRDSAARARERQTKARALAFQMHRLFLPLDEEVSCRMMDNGKMLLDIAHLIDRRCLERYQNKFATSVATLRECKLQLSGPWPPYHFVHRLTKPAHVATPVAAHIPHPAVIQAHVAVAAMATA